MENRVPSLLLIDDDDEVVLALREYLVRSGYVVDAARDLHTARRIFPIRKYSAVWVDLQLTGATGAECLGLLSEAKATHQQAKLIAATAYASPALQQSAAALGADLFIQKPVDPHCAMKRLCALMGHDVPAEVTA